MRGGRALHRAMPPKREPKNLGALSLASFREYVRFSGGKRVLDSFRDLDTDGSGELELKEFGKAIISMGFVDATKADIEATFAALDSDGSGKISYKELDKRLREKPVESSKTSDAEAFRASTPTPRDASAPAHVFTALPAVAASAFTEGARSCELSE